MLGDANIFSRRFCQRRLIGDMNESGLEGANGNFR